MSADLGFVHRYVPGEESGVTLLVLHGTGGNEEDLIPLGKDLVPSANILSPRGKILEHGMPRFFRRLAEGVFDHEDLVLRTHELAHFIEAAAEEYGFDRSKLIAVVTQTARTSPRASCSCIRACSKRRYCSGRWSRSSRKRRSICPECPCSWRLVRGMG